MDAAALIAAGTEGAGGPLTGGGSQMARSSMAADATRYGAVFLVMMSNLLLELLMTRLFSATMWYHFAFMAVSIALFGTTVGAVVVHLWPQHFRVERAWQLAARYAVLYAASIVVCIALQLRINVTFGATWRELATLAAVYVLIAVPFTLSGIFICLALIRADERLGAVYCADLLGAGVACAVFVPLMAHADGPRAVLLLAAVAGAGAALMAMAARDARTLALALAGAALCVVVFATHWDGGMLQVRWAKGYREPLHAIEKWSAFARVMVDPIDATPFGWGMSTRVPAPPRRVAQQALNIDNGALTVVTAFDGDLAAVAHLQWDVTALAHAIRPQGSVLVIGVGGGRDVLTALTYGHQRIVGAEINRDILDLLRGPLAEFSGGLGTRPGVELVNDEGRSYAARSREQFDIVQASLVDTFAAAANGAYVLSENALYTTEGFGVFLDRLKPDGVLSFSRWYFSAQPGETLRLLSLASTVLRRRGVTRPQDQLYLVRSGPYPIVVATLLVGARPFTPEEVAALRQWCATRGFEELLGPGFASSDALAQLAGPEEPSAWLDTFPVDLRAPVDDRPFFFNMLRLRDAFTLHTQQSDAVKANATAVVALAWLLIIVIVLSATFIVVPLWRGGARSRLAPHAPVRLVYFAGVGVGFILIEIAQMQRLMIALGHPVYGLTVVLFSFLVAAGMGSLWTGRVVRRGGAARWLRGALVVLLLVAVLTAAGGMAAADLLASAPTWLRITGSVALLAPLGFALGIPLATGLALSASDPPRYRALYWGVNGAASVCGSVFATILSLTFGITVSYGVGVLAYAVSAAAATIAFPSGSSVPVSGAANKRAAALG